eukprot:835510-Rhodomonas_salina.1
MICYLIDDSFRRNAGIEGAPAEVEGGDSTGRVNGRQSDSSGVHEDRKRSRAQSKSERDIAAIMKQFGVGSPNPTSPSQSGGSPEG